MTRFSKQFVPDLANCSLSTINAHEPKYELKRDKKAKNQKKLFYVISIVWQYIEYA